MRTTFGRIGHTHWLVLGMGFCLGIAVSALTMPRATGSEQDVPERLADDEKFLGTIYSAPDGNDVELVVWRDPDSREVESITIDAGDLHCHLDWDDERWGTLGTYARLGDDDAAIQMDVGLDGRIDVIMVDGRTTGRVADAWIAGELDGPNFSADDGRRFRYAPGVGWKEAAPDDTEQSSRP